MTSCASPTAVSKELALTRVERSQRLRAAALSNSNSVRKTSRINVASLVADATSDVLKCVCVCLCPALESRKENNGRPKTGGAHTAKKYHKQPHSNRRITRLPYHDLGLVIVRREFLGPCPPVSYACLLTPIPVSMSCQRPSGLTLDSLLARMPVGVSCPRHCEQTLDSLLADPVTSPTAGLSIACRQVFCARPWLEAGLSSAC